MPLALQAKILRLLQEQSFERVGGNETIRTDVRLIAATHRDLIAWSAEGKFRPDLYYRLGVFTIHLPPLRERGDDLPMLVQHYLRRFSRELGREVREVDPEAMERLRAYAWPGNIRELQSVLKQALLQASGTILLAAFLPELAGKPGESGSAPCGGSRSRPGSIHPPTACSRRQRPVRGNAPPGGPALAAPRSGVHRWEPTPGRPPAGDRPANPAAETSRPGAARHPRRRKRRRRPDLADAAGPAERAGAISATWLLA